MRFLIPAALAALMAGPALGQRLRLENEPPAPEPTPYHYATPEQLAETRGPPLGACERSSFKATKEFAENINAASAAFGSKDYVAALKAVERARPHAQPGAQMSAVAQIEVASILQLGGEVAAIPKLEAILSNPCIRGTVRQDFTKILDEARAKAAAAPPH
jgi:hypothetical protein